MISSLVCLKVIFIIIHQKAVESYGAHPIRILYENGVKLTINTDDLLIFDSTIENEYLMLYKAGALSAEALDDIRLNGLKSRGGFIE